MLLLLDKLIALANRHTGLCDSAWQTLLNDIGRVHGWLLFCFLARAAPCGLPRLLPDCRRRAASQGRAPAAAARRNGLDGRGATAILRRRGRPGGVRPTHCLTWVKLGAGQMSRAAIPAECHGAVSGRGHAVWVVSARALDAACPGWGWPFRVGGGRAGWGTGRLRPRSARGPGPPGRAWRGPATTGGGVQPFGGGAGGGGLRSVVLGVAELGDGVG